MSHLTPLHVLVAAPRPVDLPNCPPRSRVEACYEALEEQGEQVVAEWLWPASLAALTERLAATELPAVDVLYLDGVADQGGDSPYLYLEGAAGASHLVGLVELETLFIREGLPVLLLATDKPWPAAEWALADLRLPNLVLLERHLSPAQLTQALTAFLSGLLAGQPVGQAATEARLGRLYQAGGDNPLPAPPAPAGAGVSKAVRFPNPALAPAWQRLATDPTVGGLPPGPAHGLVGRGRELSALEYALRGTAGNGIVLLHGYEGVGKTTLALHAARWLVRTGRFEQVVYTALHGGGHREAALYDLGVRLLGDDFQLRTEGALEQMEQALTETPTLIIWDHLEAVLDGSEFALGAERLAQLLQTGQRLAGLGPSRLLVLCATTEIPDAAYQEGQLSLSLALGNVADDEALALLEAMLHKAEANLPPVDQVQELVRVLGGQPLALGLLVPLLCEQPIDSVLEGLQAVMPGLRTGEARLRNQALDVALETLLRALSEEQRAGLLKLSLFEGGLMRPLIGSITGMGDQEWEALAGILLRTGALYQVEMPGFSVPLLRLHPALPRHLARRLIPEGREALEKDYYVAHASLLGWMVEGEKRSSLPIRTLVRCELPNVRHVMRLLLRAQKLKEALELLSPLQYYLLGYGFQQEYDTLLAQTQQVATEAMPSEGPLGHMGVRFMLNQGEQMLANGQVQQAGALLQQLLMRMEGENGLSYSGAEADYDHALVLHRLGRCYHASGHPEMAMPAYTRAAELLNGMPVGTAARRDLLLVYRDMSDTAFVAGQLPLAEDGYQHILALAEALQDQDAAATAHAQLANCALTRGDLAQARELAQAALAGREQLGDKAGQANAWNLLGAIAWRGQDPAEARQALLQTIALAEEAGHGALQAQACMQLAALDDQAGRVPEAEASYAQAIRLFGEQDAATAQVGATLSLARLLLRQGQLPQALAQAEAARQVVERLEGEGQPWEVYALLSEISTAQEDEVAAAQWRTRAQTSFAGSADAEMVAQNWEPVIHGVAQACCGEPLSDDTLQLVEKMDTDTHWQRLVAVIWRILAGERDAELYAPLDHVDALIARRILEAIAAPPAA